MDKYFLVLQINIINIRETQRYRLSLLLKSALLAIFHTRTISLQLSFHRGMWISSALAAF